MHKARSVLLVLTSLILVPFAFAATAQDSKDTFGSLPGFTQQETPAATNFGDSRDVVGVEITLLQETAPPGAVIPVAVVLDMKPTWHIWTNEGGELEGTSSFEYAQWTQITLAEDSGFKLIGIQWPEAHKVDVNFGDGPVTYSVFEGKAVAFVNLLVPGDDANGTELPITISTSFQACDDTQCMAPTFDPPTVTNTLKIDDAAPMRVEATGLFADWKPATGRRSPSRGSRSRPSTDSPVVQEPADGEPEPPSTAEPHPPPTDGATEPEGKAAADSAVTADLEETATSSSFFGVRVPKTDGALGLVLLILMSIAGGFVLNLTPCVLPVIPIKIMTISKHADSPGRALSLGLWMALGVFGFWLLIGLPVAFLTTFTDPSVIFGIWWVTLGIGLLIGLMGIGIMGLFNFQLPQSVYMVNPKADNAGGSFLFGVMTAVLGLPCFGFVAGALLAGTATLPPYITLVIFGSIGLGMALPYLVLSAKPSLVERIPRTGPASELVKQVMGLLLLAAAAYFVGSGLIGLTAEMPWVAKQIHWWAISFAMIIAGIWLCLRTFQITPSWGARGFWTLVALVFAFLPTLVAVRATEKAHETWIELASLDSTSFSTKVWNPYTPERFEAARKDGKIVVMDFTAEWCLNCKALKAAVLDVEPVKSRLADDPNIVTFTADNTSRNAPGWQLMKELGQTGIPLLAIWGPDESLLKPWQSNAYTATQVIDAISEREDPGNAQK
ncbi:MAG: thioredoxin family protein [Phycisphaerales bacterium]|nr:thioredoxin family protein [Phycisphaerales bacterium]